MINDSFVGGYGMIACQQCISLTEKEKRIMDLELALQDARLFVVYIESLGRGENELSKYDLRSDASVALERIDAVL